jgi:hypothetical protein
MTMLDLLPYNVAYAVAESFMHRYLHSVFAWQTQKPINCLKSCRNMLFSNSQDYAHHAA